MSTVHAYVHTNRIGKSGECDQVQSFKNVNAGYEEGDRRIMGEKYDLINVENSQLISVETKETWKYERRWGYKQKLKRNGNANNIKRVNGWMDGSNRAALNQHLLFFIVLNWFFACVFVFMFVNRMKKKLFYDCYRLCRFSPLIFKDLDVCFSSFHLSFHSFTHIQ